MDGSPTDSAWLYDGMIDPDQLRTRTAELERHFMGRAPVRVRERAEFDIKALKFLLALMERGIGDKSDGRVIEC
jgi:hypothetical protein